MSLSISFEEFRNFLKFIGIKSELLLQQNIPICDHILVKSYITNILKTPVTQELHFKYIKAINNMIDNGMLKIIAESNEMYKGIKSTSFRFLLPDANLNPLMFVKIKYRN